LDYDEQIVNDRFDNLLTFLVYEDHLHEALHYKLLTYVGNNNMDALIRPILSYDLYDLPDGFTIEIGITSFKEDNFYSEFHYNKIKEIKGSIVILSGCSRV
jgi:hypothetical protein